jgi:FkbM family methyltransferase
VLDVGANSGQFAVDLRRAGFRGEIFSIEPGQKAFRNLQDRSKRDDRWQVFNFALGSTEGKLKLNISQNSGLSSSFLKMSNLHLENFPDSKFIKEELVNVTTLQLLTEELNLSPQNMLLKIDVQGFESEVLKGAGNLLSEIPMCYLEVSLSALYDGEFGLLEILNFLSGNGHEVIDLYRGVTSKSGDLLQIDILTIRKLL